MFLSVDHIVVAARTLAEGVAWCESTLGITPGPGGKHAFMGTHNRVFSIASARFPRTHLEIIAIDPAALAPARTRWFDLDDPAMQAALERGPQLIHWVARCDDVQAAVLAMLADDIDRGEVLQAERPTTHGALRWRISVRADDRRLFDGALPTLIQWGDVHPADGMPDSGVSLERVTLAGLPQAVEDLLPATVAIDRDRHAAPISVVLQTPAGAIDLALLDPVSAGCRAASR